MIEQHEIDAVDSVAAFRVLYLLPTAPLSLAGEVYRALRDRCLLSADGDAAQLDEALDRLDSAHEAVARGTDGIAHDAPALRSPWVLLHVDCDAPPEVVDVAYRYWQRERGLADAAFARPARPRVEKPSPTQTPPAPLPQVDVLSIATPPVPAGAARLVVVAGVAHPASATIGEKPLRVGGDAACDVVVGPKSGRTEARLWQREGRVMFHSVAGDTNVNGRVVVWAVLAPGDAVHVGDATFRYEASLHPSLS